MLTATSEKIAALETLAGELGRNQVQRGTFARERDRDLRAIELELASAVSIVEELAARALPDRRDILETAYAAPLPIHEVGQLVDSSHERVENTLEVLALASFHWEWRMGTKVAHAGETRRVMGAGSVLQHPRISVSAAHD